MPANRPTTLKETTGKDSQAARNNAKQERKKSRKSLGAIRKSTGQ